MVNLDGKTVIPGLTDAHLHWEAQARAMRSVNVFEAPEKTDRGRAGAGARHVKRRPASGSTGQGWAQDLWLDRTFPEQSSISTTVAPRHPVYLSAKSGHAAWVNSAATESRRYY